jgi:hypothetical protein
MSGDQATRPHDSSQAFSLRDDLGWVFNEHVREPVRFYTFPREPNHTRPMPAVSLHQIVGLTFNGTVFFLLIAY